MPTQEEGVLREGAFRAKLPTEGTVVKIAGSTYLIHIDGLRAVRRFGADRLEPMSLVDILGSLGG